MDTGKNTSRRGEAMARLLEETTRLAHRLRAEGQRQGLVTQAGRSAWGVLRELARHGPQTVPQMAARRPVARQHIQKTVDGLLAGRLVRLVPNPAHRRSSLVALTARGRREEARQTALFMAFAERLAAGLDTGELEAATTTLTEVHDRLVEAAPSGGRP